MRLLEFVYIEVAAALIGIFTVSVFFSIDRFRKLGYVCIILAILLILAALYLNASYEVKNVIAYWPLLILTIVFLVVVMYLGAKKNRIARYAVLVWLFWAVVYFGVLVYPYWFGGVVSSQSYLVNAVTGKYTLAVTLIGGLFLVIALSYFIYITYLKKSDNAVGY